MADQDLHIRILGDSSSIERASSRANVALNNLRNNTKKLAQDLAKAVKVLSVATAGVGIASIKLASDYNESLNKVNVAFKDNAKEVQKWAKTTRKAFGIAEGTALEIASLFGDMATGMGLSTKQASIMATELGGLAGDLASFKNISIEEAMNALKGVFTGETESLKNLGIIMTDAELSAYALSKGIKTATKDMSSAEKVALRYEYVIEKTSNAQGDFARTSDGFANKLRSLKERFKEISTNLGQYFIPYAERALEAVDNFLDTLKNSGAIDTFKTKLNDFGEGLRKVGEFALNASDSIVKLGKVLAGLFIALKLGLLQLTVTTFRTMYDEIKKATDATRRYNTELQNVSRQLAILQAQSIQLELTDFDGVGAGVFETRFLDDEGNEIAELASEYAMLDRRQHQLRNSLDETAQSMSWFGRTILRIKTAFSNAGGGLAGLAAGFSALGATVTASLSSLSASLASVATAVGWVIAIIVAVVAVVYGMVVAVRQLWQENTQFRQEILYLGETFAVVFGAIYKILVAVSKVLIAILKGLFVAIVAVLKTLVVFFTGVMVELVNLIKITGFAIWDFVKGFFITMKGLAEFIVGVVALVMAIFNGNWEDAIDMLEQSMSSLFDGLKSMGVGVLNIVLSVAESIINTVLSAINGITSGINTIINKANEVAGTNFGTIGQIGKLDLAYNPDAIGEGATGGRSVKKGADKDNPFDFKEYFANLFGKEDTTDNPFKFDFAEFFKGLTPEEFKDSLGGKIAPIGLEEELNIDDMFDGLDDTTNGLGGLADSAGALNDELKKTINYYKIQLGEIVKNNQLFTPATNRQTISTFTSQGKEYSAFSNIVIQNMNVRNDSDVEAIAKQINNLQRRENRRLAL